MINSLKCFMLFSILVGLLGLFMVTLVQVTSAPKPTFGKAFTPTGFVSQSAA